MACISCGVITSAWLCRNSSLCVSAMLRCNIGPVLAYIVPDRLYTPSLATVLTTPARHLPANWAPAMGQPLHAEFFAQIEPADFGVVDDLVGGAFAQHLTRIDDVGAIREAKGFAHIVVGDQHADAASGEMAHQLLDVADRDRVDAGERLVEQHVGRAGGERTRDL